MQPYTIKESLEAHHKECYGWAIHCCGLDKDMAQDVLQNAYLKIIEKQSSYKEQATFKTWAFAVIRNTALDAIKKSNRERRRISGEQHLTDAIEQQQPTDPADGRLKQQFFTEALLLLSERQREIFQLVFYHDLSLREAGQVLHISTGSASRHYDRAKKRLLTWLHQKGININNYNGLI
jgi:RNA polymerase sigma-70 factor (ECF subfamily)